MAGLYTLSLSRLRSGLQNREYTATDAVESCLERIKATEPKLNACISVLDASALDQAKALDREGPRADKPLWGVPVTLQDSIGLQGCRMTCASKALENYTAFFDAEVTARLKSAGAIIIATTNLDEFGLGYTTESSIFRSTANPWDTGCVPGGSGGGSAASVAAGQSFASIGGDTGGSLRLPAALCGCVGIKPTYGRVSRYGAASCSSSMDQLGPVTRTAEDCARVFEVLAAPDPKDAASARLDLFPDGLPAQNFTASALAAAADPAASLRGLKLGLPAELWECGLSPEVGTACKAALARLEKQGAVLVPISVPRQKYVPAVYRAISWAELSTNMAKFDGIRFGYQAKGVKDLEDLYIRSRSESLGLEAQLRIVLGTLVLSSGFHEQYFRKAAKARRLILGDWEKALDACDLALAPTSADTAWKFGPVPDEDGRSYKIDLLAAAGSLTGMPSLTLPVGLGADTGLPVGLQLMGKPFDEARLFGVAAALEKLMPELGLPAI